MTVGPRRGLQRDRPSENPDDDYLTLGCPDTRGVNILFDSSDYDR